MTVTPCCDTINDRGQIVGFSVDAGGMHGFLWEANVFTDLNNLIPQDSPWQLQLPLSINDDGEITGQGMINGELHAFLAVPTGSGGPAARGATKPPLLPQSVKATLQRRLR